MNAVAPAPRRRFKDAGNADGDVLPSKQECTKKLKELNREAARYQHILLGIGGSQDSTSLRTELTRIRRKIFEVARQARDLFLPHINSKEKSCHYKSLSSDIERLWNCYICCLDSIEDKLQRTLILQRNFHFYIDQTVLINTGVTENGIKTLSMEHLDNPAEHRSKAEEEDLKLLEKDIEALQGMVTDLIEISALHPWEIEPEMDASKFECSKSLHSMSDTSSVAEESVSIQGNDRQRRKKCLCIAACILISLVVFATVLGLCIAFVG